MKNLLAIILIALTLNSLAINPTREYDRTPELFGIPFSEYKIRTPDHYSINVWEYAPLENSTPNKIIILVGPDAGNMSFIIWQAKMLRDKGIRVIAFDYRGFGKSSDYKIIREHLYHSEFAIDLDTVIENTKKKYPQEKIGLYSLSMGTYISLIAKEKVDFQIAEGFYNDPQKVVERIRNNKGKVVTLPADSISVNKVKPSIPFLIFCATHDKTTTTADAQHFKAKNDVSIVELEGDHLMGIHILKKEIPGDLYMEIILEFLRKNNM